MIHPVATDDLRPPPHSEKIIRLEDGATTVETNRNEVDIDSIVSHEIEIQTGLKPVSVLPTRQISNNPLTKTLFASFLKPTEGYWSLFGSRMARLLDKSDRLRQCETCWGYHFARNCYRRPVCQGCGKAGHIMDNCAAPEQCVNCLAPMWPA
ncbi:hypothetical protein FBEOM_14434 [Fusarium beomiforme]|uniref:CCHC-type domain-containing protein n=1 Tax=Fusarium beomiforme TaxID=44412 RepID=A0A9P5A5B4_9HYPO|nr:hypothetical protein FBEOM_14434 [Fusarium beomiforme]